MQEISISAEPPRPEALGDDDHRWRSRLIVRRREQTPAKRGHTKRIQDAPCYPSRRHAFGFIGAACADSRSAHLVAAELCERAIVTLIEEDAGVGLIDLEGSPHLQRVRNRNQPFRLRIRQRPQQDGVGNAEDCRGGAEAPPASGTLYW